MNKSKRNRLNLGKEVMIATCLAVIIMFVSCGKDKNSDKLKVGQEHEGGIIAYIDATGKHGLIAAKQDQSIGIIWYKQDLGTFATGAVGTEIWTGQSNTEKIVEKQGEGEYAARLCYDLVLNGYDDWFLPSIDELDELYKNREKIGGFVSTSKYWSSSEGGYNGAFYKDFGGGGGNLHKAEAARVRAVRYF